MSTLSALIDLQSGVVTRAQLLEHGVPAITIRRRLRRRDLVVVSPGVYVEHTGPLTWLQRAWCGVLAVWPAALSHASALRADDGPGRRDVDTGPIHVAIDRHRSPAAPPGVVLHHQAGLHGRVRWNLAPPRVQVEYAVLDVAAQARSELTTIAVLADAVQARRTTAGRLGVALDSSLRVRRRELMVAVLRDIDGGTCSALEHGFLTRVEREHGLPTAGRQVRDSARGVYRDVEYSAQSLVVELDGRAFHDDARSRDRDLERDLAAAATGRATVRVGWGQVFDRPCATAHHLGRLLQRRGWTGAPRVCAQCPVEPAPYLGATG